MDINFEKLLLCLLAATCSVIIVDKLSASWQIGRHMQCGQPGWRACLAWVWHKLKTIAYSSFGVLLLVVVFRSFIIEPFRIPSSSLAPTLLPGDFILTNKFIYGVKLPLLGQTMLEITQPQRGDIVVFRWPPNPNYYFIKRVIGVPGDHITYVHKMLTINGYAVPRKFTHEALDDNVLRQYQENLLGVVHDIYLATNKYDSEEYDIVVPDHAYFVMGDNRDRSADSRVWGLVPEDNIVGKAMLTWFSWDGNADWGHKIRLSRMGGMIH